MAKKMNRDMSVNQRYSRLLGSSKRCMASNKFRAAANQTLKAVVLIGSENVWDSKRWKAFACSYFLVMGGRGLDEGFTDKTYEKVIEADKSSLLNNFVNNVQEPVIYQALALYLLAVWAYKNEGNEKLAVKYCERMLSLELDDLEACRGLDNCFRMNEENTQAPMQLVKEIFEDVRIRAKALHSHMKSQNPRPFVFQGKKELSTEEFFLKPPSVTSSIVEQVRSLPEKDETVFICSFQAPTIEIAAEIAAQMGTHCSKPMGYLTFCVDMKRVQSGSKNARKVFRILKSSAYDPNDTPAKHLLAAFCHVCLQPGERTQNFLHNR